ncbi:MAG: hypothetical protein J5I98_06040 [Phaeodactylibacter sp.]|nr:hypothetical protein [Phaeodactylibacter sp.]
MLLSIAVTIGVMVLRRYGIAVDPMRAGHFARQSPHALHARIPKYRNTHTFISCLTRKITNFAALWFNAQSRIPIFEKKS